MFALWLVAGLFVIGIVSVVISRSRRDRRDDLGAVSHSWVAEQRFGRDRNG
jgi:hypothetical protein